MMPTWLGNNGAVGWTGVDSGPDGVFGVSVLPPRTLGSKPRVIKCGSVSTAQLDAGVLARLAKTIATGGCAWTITLARKDYSLLVVPEPPVLQTEMEQSIRWSVGTMLDYPVDEANLAWMKIPTVENLPNRPPHLYVVAARSDLVTQVSETFRDAKLALKAIDIRETAQRNIAALAERQGEGLGLLLVGKQGVQFTISFKGEMYLDRYVEEALFDDEVCDEEAEIRAFERIALQVQRSLDFIARTMPFINVERVLVAPTPAETGLTAYLAQNIPTAVENLDLSSIFDFSLMPALAKPENQALYFTALGAALRFMNKSI